MEVLDAYRLQVPAGRRAEGAAAAAVGEGGGGLIIGRKRHDIVPRAVGNAGAEAWPPERRLRRLLLLLQGLHGRHTLLRLLINPALGLRNNCMLNDNTKH